MGFKRPLVRIQSLGPSPYGIIDTMVPYGFFLLFSTIITESNYDRSFHMSNILGFYAPDQENGYLSNWYPCTFRYGQYKYSSAEQFMMAQKAALFRDYDCFFKILRTDDQGKIKRL